MSFWMLFLEGGHAPTFKHGTKKSARDEAKRIAMLHPGKRVWVLEAIASCVKEEVQWSDARGEPTLNVADDDIPF